jgi:hypothetical protein
VLAIFTAVLAVVSMSQISLLIRADKTARLAANAAEKAAIATEASVATMKDTAQRQLRAYVGVEHADLLPGRVARLVIKNTGQTPAYDFAVAVMSTVDDYPTPTALLSDEITPGGPRATLGADSVREKEIPFATVPDHEVDGFRDGTRVLYVYGRLAYRDVFNEDRWTTFRYVFDADRRTVVAAAGGNQST